MSLKSRLNSNLGWVLASFSVLFFVFFIRTGFHPFISVSSYLNIFSLAIIVLILPDYIVRRGNHTERWFTTPEFYTVVLIIGLTFLGLLVSFIPFLSYVIYILWLIGLFLLVWTIIQIRSEFRLVSLILPIFIGFVFILDVYHSEALSPLFYESIVLGSAFFDVLNHAAISSIISEHLASSTGVDGIVHYSYHWGSHAIFGGLKNIVGVDSITFYNVAYPTIFLMLLFKTMVSFTLRVSHQLSSDKVSETAIMVIMVILFSISLFVTRAFSWMESTTMANIFMMLYLGTLLVYLKSNNRVNPAFLIFSFIVLLALSTIKISHGFVLIAGILYLVMRTQKDFKLYASLIVLGSVTIWFVLNYVLLFDQIADDARDLSGTVLIHYFVKRMQVFWTNSGMTWTYFAGILMSIIALSRMGYFKNVESLKSALTEHKVLEFEFLVVLNLVGLAGAIYVSEHGLDVFFFMSVQILISTIYLMQLFAKKLSNLSLHPGITVVLILLILSMSLISRPEMVDHLFQRGNYQRQMQILNADRQTVHDLLVDLTNSENQWNPKSVAIYIPQSEHWYYGSQSNMIGAPFIVPSISGLVTIGGISEHIWYSENSRYGYNVYRLKRDSLIYELDDAISSARNYGFETLLVYRQENGRLAREIVQL